MNYLSSITATQRPWLLLAASALAFELSALFFQYVLKLEPCIMCVYQRLAILTIVAAGTVGAIGYKNIIFRSLGFSLWGIGSIWGLQIALEHVEIQSNSSPFFFSCEFIPNFPSWAPLHEWFPLVFEATGDCGEIAWQFLGYSMPQWMVVVFGAYALAFITVLVCRLIGAKKP